MYPPHLKPGDTVLIEVALFHNNKSLHTLCPHKVTVVKTVAGFRYIFGKDKAIRGVVSDPSGPYIHRNSLIGIMSHSVFDYNLREFRENVLYDKMRKHGI